jgi:hypothetical protein
MNTENRLLCQDEGWFGVRLRRPAPEGIANGGLGAHALRLPGAREKS